MTTNIKILPDYRLLFVDLRGVLLAHELRNQCEDILETLAEKAPGGVIVETRNGSAEDFDVREMKLLILELQRVGHLPRGYRVAIIAKQDLSYGLGRIIQAAAQAAQFDVRTFRSKVEALTFLLPADTASNFPDTPFYVSAERPA